MPLHPFVAEELVRDRARALVAPTSKTNAPAPSHSGRTRRAFLTGLRFRLAGLPVPPCPEGC